VREHGVEGFGGFEMVQRAKPWGQQGWRYLIASTHTYHELNASTL
jgi:hypothetical protein